MRRPDPTPKWIMAAAAFVCAVLFALEWVAYWLGNKDALSGIIATGALGTVCAIASLLMPDRP